MRRLRFTGALILFVIPVLVAAAFRIPAILSSRHLGYDDGVYGASVELMGAGYAPFRDFFSSQGPVFLPLLRVADMLTPHSRFGVRFAMLLTGVSLALGVYLVARRYAARPVAVGLAVLAGCSGTMLAAAAPLQSDGVALAFGTFAIAALLAPSPPGRLRPVAVGFLVGLGLMTKSLHLLPVAIVIGAAYFVRRSWSALASWAVAMVITGLAVTLPWGIGAVWDDYVAFHLSRPDHTSWLENVAETARLLFEYEPMILLLGATAVISALVGLRSDPPVSEAEPVPAWLPAVWLGITVVVLVGFSTVDAGFLRFLAFAVFPLLVTIAQLRPRVEVVVAFAIAAVPLQWIASSISHVHELTEVENQVVSRMDDLTPGSLVVSDDPGLGWVAEAMSHPTTVDMSFGRVEAGDVTAAEVATAIADPDTCVVLSWTGRLDDLGIEPPTVGYAPAEEFGEGQWLAVREACLTG